MNVSVAGGRKVQVEVKVGVHVEVSVSVGDGVTVGVFEAVAETMAGLEVTI